MPIFTKKNGLIYCVYYDHGKKVWEPFGRGEDAKKAAEVRALEIQLKKSGEGGLQGNLSRFRSTN